MNELFYYLSRDKQVDVIYNYLKIKVQKDPNFIENLDNSVYNNLYILNNELLHPILPEDYPLIDLGKELSKSDSSKLFRKMSLILHPDKISDENIKPIFQEIFQILNNTKQCTIDDPKSKYCIESTFIKMSNHLDYLSNSFTSLKLTAEKNEEKYLLSFIIAFIYSGVYFRITSTRKNLLLKCLLWLIWIYVAYLFILQSNNFYDASKMQEKARNLYFKINLYRRENGI
jgi:hypothetical protein